MTQRRVTATNQLATVIDVLQLGKKTGTLTVERGEGATFEEGTMTFVSGQVIQATLGPYIGREAATRLFSWQACRFMFVPGQPAPPDISTLPTPRIPSTPPAHPDISTLPTPRMSPAPPTHPDTLPTPQTLPDLKAIQRGTTGPLYRYQKSDPTTYGDLSLRPAIAAYSKESMDAVLHILDQNGLSRTHRRLFLLIDGRRSIKDLAMLLRRTPGETAVMLADLERAGLIQL